eukprot:TRINITY_DN7975_c0_g1_i14.p5 TRINITY_DN7975_c0_g1~~TRINITY_DN7975_c0_g1_i14.p5  ORF type:complete len:128 (-),score=33.50 TRINITY_DN7975_c0_g1_i14:658-1041(-)
MWCGLSTRYRGSLEAALHEVFEVHLFRKKDINKQMRRLLSQLSRAPTLSEFQRIVEVVRAGRPTLASKLEEKQKRFAKCAADHARPKYAHATSNVAESLNTTLEEVRFVDAVDGLFIHLRNKAWVPV